jgi:hypothetical protein
MLPSKTIPEVNRKGHTRTLKAKAKMTTGPRKNKARARSIEVEETEDNDTTGNITKRNASFNASITSISPESFHPKKVCSLFMLRDFISIRVSQKAKNMKKSPIYLFYEIVTNGSDGTPGDDGDVHYRCLHGSHKVCTIKKSMRSNLNGMS